MSRKVMRFTHCSETDNIQLTLHLVEETPHHSIWQLTVFVGVVDAPRLYGQIDSIGFGLDARIQLYNQTHEWSVCFLINNNISSIKLKMLLEILCNTDCILPFPAKPTMLANLYNDGPQTDRRYNWDSMRPMQSKAYG